MLVSSTVVAQTIFPLTRADILAGSHFDFKVEFGAVVDPDQIKVTVEENTKLTIEGPDKMVVGKVASEIRAFYPPEPYKGKGVRYAGEHVVRKEGKTVQ